MSIRKHPSGYLVTICLGRDPDTGKKKNHYKTFPTKREAEQYERDQTNAVVSKTFVTPTKITVLEHLRRWLEVKAAQLSERTIDDYQIYIDLYLCPKAPGVPSLRQVTLERLSPMLVQEFYAKLASRTSETTGKRLSATTIRKAHTILHGALRQAVRWRLLPNNPAAEVEVPKPNRLDKEKVKAMNHGQVHTFIAAAQGHRFEHYLHFALNTAMRPSEILALAWDAIDFEKRTVTVTRALSRRKGKWGYVAPKTRRGRRLIEFPPEFIFWLKKRKAQQAEERLQAGEEWQENGLVFTTPKGTPLELRNLLQRQMRPLLTKAKLPTDFDLYSLRHTAISLALAEGVDMKTVSERAGHASAAFTLDVYGHVMPSQQAKAAEAMGRALYGTR